MKQLTRRVARLEMNQRGAHGPQQTWRVVISQAGKSLNIDESTCKRTLNDDLLTEIVELNGSRDDVTDEDLDKFVAGFPIEARTPHRANLRGQPGQRANGDSP